MEIRVYNKEESKVVYTTKNDIERVLLILNTLSGKDIEIQLIYTASLIRRVDAETFINACQYIVAFIKTEYYSGQGDGSFTTTDSY